MVLLDFWFFEVFEVFEVFGVLGFLRFLMFLRFLRFLRSLRFLRFGGVISLRGRMDANPHLVLGEGGCHLHVRRGVMMPPSNPFR